MNDDDYGNLEKRLADVLQRDTDRTVSNIIGTVFLDWAVIRKSALYPALAELLGMECECRTIECKGCEDVEEWLAELDAEGYGKEPALARASKPVALPKSQGINPGCRERW